ncbi:MAG: site-specific DNA-methyltransferase [Treponema sp.]|nr:site-specific DNA-methyltransferase [Treponema sp.]
MLNKIRAQKNRTLTVEEHEVPELKKGILVPAELEGSASSHENALINGDMMEATRKLPDGFADLIIIDPPYNLSKNFNGLAFNAMKTEEYDAYLESWLPLVCSKLKDGGSLYLCGDWKCTASLQRALERHLTVINRITWQREKGRGAKSNWKNAMEDIWFAVKDPKNYFFDVEAVKIKRRVIAPYREKGQAKDWEQEEGGKFRMTYPSNFWDDISIPFWSMPENTDHPTQKSEKLYAKLILASSRPGDMVFDPFAGSGTAAVVAKKLGRRYCAVELNGEYCLYAAKRLALAEENKSIQGYTDGVFWERNTIAFQKKTQ